MEIVLVATIFVREGHAEYMYDPGPLQVEAAQHFAMAINDVLNSGGSPGNLIHLLPDLFTLLTPGRSLTEGRTAGAVPASPAEAFTARRLSVILPDLAMLTACPCLLALCPLSPPVFLPYIFKYFLQGHGRGNRTAFWWNSATDLVIPCHYSRTGY